MRKIFAYLSIVGILVADASLLLYGLGCILVEMGAPDSVFGEFVKMAVYQISFRIATAIPICYALNLLIKQQE